jgi:hypothetical protein
MSKMGYEWYWCIINYSITTNEQETHFTNKWVFIEYAPNIDQQSIRQKEPPFRDTVERKQEINVADFLSLKL